MEQRADGLLVAVDGPSGSGKSSVSRGVARQLGMAYLDTGAMYRALTWAMLRDGVDIDTAADVAGACQAPVLTMGTDPDASTVMVDGEDVSAEIREEAVTAAVSRVSAVPAVRERLVRVQREVADRCRATGRGVVVEGRDIGTVVLPDADLKVFLVADPAVRAARRAAEDAGRAGADAVDAAAVARTEMQLRQRDALDSGREASPLTRADDAVEVDATLLDLPQVIEVVVGLVEDVRSRRAG